MARFYHADCALTAVASELDSFDGRAEPERCSRLVSRLRQGQVNPCFQFIFNIVNCYYIKKTTLIKHIVLKIFNTFLSACYLYIHTY